MRNPNTKFLPFAFSLLLFTNFTNNGYAQTKSVYSIDSLGPKFINWYNLSPKVDKAQGAEVDRAYRELLVDKKPKTKIVVAVIDSGTDYEHADLAGKVWENKDEIANNGIDDDNNGYIDDIHGWGFLGNSKGENISDENVEQTRIYRELNTLYWNVKSTDTLTELQKKEYNLYKQTEKSYQEGLAKYSKQLNNVNNFERDLKSVEDIIKTYLGKQSFSIGELEFIQSSDGRVMAARDYLKKLYQRGFTHQELKEAKDHFEQYVNKHYNLSFFPRKIIGDNPKDINDKNYGNNDVKGPRADHGTPVAGVIAANRNNNIGVDGIAESVELMILRAVPNGDERDKDIALAIRYAVDNGANIINMSFGKKFSPQKDFVDEAMKYADEKNVLIVHSAGNEAANLDVSSVYPTKVLNNGAVVNSWITVGANSKKLGKELCGNFSNYGHDGVDLFAPGVSMIMLAPGNKYAKMDGTSFSGPVVSGVAALVWSYYPELTAIELKEVLLNSCTVYPKRKVITPNIENGKKSKVLFSQLSKTGGIVNAYQALIQAEKKANEKMKVTSNL